MAQPNFQLLGQHLIAASEQIRLIPNMHPANFQQGFAQQTQQHAAALAQQAEQHNAALAQQAEKHNAALAQEAERHNAVIQRLDNLLESQQRLPILLHNATASHDAPLAYPPGVGDAGLPVTKDALLTLTVADCIALAEVLGLPALPAFPAPTVIIRRQQILDFLGCAIRAE
ncbi:hypothetical protein F5887DRAFT_1226713 [Amanita rubescens]|nr:hypothetical protein F5887DRAFT_1226713 [Amanita rubescens]